MRLLRQTFNQTFKATLIRLLVGCMLLGTASAQDASGASATDAADYAVLIEPGLGLGWPGYQLYHAYAAFQKDAFGLVFRGSWTELGPFVSLAARYYTPIPIPLPTFVSAGAGVFGGVATPFASAGLQLPFLDSGARLTLELGASYQQLLGEGRVLPFVSLGLGYAFFVEAPPVSAEARAERELARQRPAGCSPREPDASGLSAVFRAVVSRKIAEAKVTYAGTYRDPEYRYAIASVSVEGSQATVTAEWEGAVTQIANGERITGSGTLEAEFVWNGCGWSLLGYTFA